MPYLLPDQSVSCFEQVDLSALARDGIRILFVDIDNTVSAFDDTACSPAAAAFLLACRKHGIEPVLFTNNTKAHALRVMAGRPEGELLTFCLKPMPFSILRILLLRQLKPHQAAVLGDQLFTDILAGRLAGVRTILCGRRDKKERKDTSVMRFFENIVYTRYEKRGLIDRRNGYVRIL